MVITRVKMSGGFRLRLSGDPEWPDENVTIRTSIQKEVFQVTRQVQPGPDTNHFIKSHEFFYWHHVVITPIHYPCDFFMEEAVTKEARGEIDII